MVLPRNSLKLDEIFKESVTPKIDEIVGTYYIDILTRFPSLRRFSHRKVFYNKNGKIFGYNVLFKKKLWGRFFLEPGISEKINLVKVIQINYGVPENHFISNKIRDHIKCIEKDKLYLGRFNYKIGKKLIFLGYFSLTKN